MARISLFCLLFVAPTYAEPLLRVGGQLSEFRRAQIVAKLEGRFLTRSYELVFANDRERQMEGEFLLSLDEGERVSAYAMDVNGIRREGIVAPAQEARRAYEEIVRQKVDPGIVEIDEEKNEFRARVFPIPAKGTKTIWLTTYQVVEAGRIPMIPTSFGEPAEWVVTVKGFYGKEDFHEVHYGAKEPIPALELDWEPLGNLCYQAGDHALRFFSRTSPKIQPAKCVQVWIDESTKYDESAIDRFAELLQAMRVEKLEATYFGTVCRDCSVVKVADFPDFFEKIRHHQARGMARLALLPDRPRGAIR